MIENFTTLTTGEGFINFQVPTRSNEKITKFFMGRPAPFQIAFSSPTLEKLQTLRWSLPGEEIFIIYDRQQDELRWPKGSLHIRSQLISRDDRETSNKWSVAARLLNP